MYGKLVLVFSILSVIGMGAEPLRLTSCRGFEAARFFIKVSKEDGLVAQTKIASLKDFSDRAYLECRETGIAPSLFAECSGRMVESGAKVAFQLSKKAAAERDPIGAITVAQPNGRSFVQLLYCDIGG